MGGWGGRNNSSFLFALLFLYSVPSTQHSSTPFLITSSYRFFCSSHGLLDTPPLSPTPLSPPFLRSSPTSHITRPLYRLPRYTLLLCTYPIPPLFLSLFLFISLARKLAPTVIFIDEIDTLLRKRESGEMSSSAGTTMQVTAKFNRRFHHSVEVTYIVERCSIV